MSCNPSIGGIGKGHLVREVDALDGLMGRVIDEAGIHFRMLNRRKGPAVQGPRAQADRDIYRTAMQAALRQVDRLELYEGSVEDLLLEGLPASSNVAASHAAATRTPRVVGVRTAEGAVLHAPRVVITTGTFMRGVVHIGKSSRPAGRYMRDSDSVEPPCTALAATLLRLKLPLSRLKTGTPPRLDGRTIDNGALEPQPSEEPPLPFSYVNEGGTVANAHRLITCYKTYTNERTHDIVRANMHTLPDYESGGGKGAGPRYCPSLFSKVERFPQREGHMVWLEPEGLSTHWVYPNGISSAFPLEVQQQLVNSMIGLENAEIVKPAYDVEYDYVDPRCLRHTLEVRECTGLYLAGQIIGTTGYEEAASLGTIAGANAALACAERPPLIIGRHEGYVGVLIDDLVTRGTQEPYRMFTSRAEWRLLLRADNADRRLTPKGAAAGCVSDERRQRLRDKESAIALGRHALASFTLPNSEWAARGFGVKPNGEMRSAEQILNVPRATLHEIEDTIASNPHGWRRGVEPPVGPAVPVLGREAVEVEIKYSNYLERQEKEVARLQDHMSVVIPFKVEYGALPCLSKEEVEKLTLARPATLREASLIPGITPKALFYIYKEISGQRQPQTGEPIASRTDSNGAEAGAEAGALEITEPADSHHFMEL